MIKVIIAIVIVIGIMVLFSSMIDSLNRPSSRSGRGNADDDWSFGDWGDDSDCD